MNLSKGEAGPAGSSRVGALVGAYRIVRRVGAGGMGEVFEAVHTSIQRRAAVKVLSAGIAGDPEQLRRFLNEARALGRIHHPGLVAIFDAGTLEDGAPYLLLEYLEGETLRARLAGGPLGARAAVRIGRQLASALAAAHAHGIVHRDVKPENVMLVPDPEVPEKERAKLLDFGIAKLETDEGPATKAGLVLGTTRYMAPEQCAGEPVSAATDAYALGIVLWEMLAGAPPFAGSAREVMRQHLGADPGEPPGPPALGQLVRRLLAKSPAHRPEVGWLAEHLPEVITDSAATPAASSTTVQRAAAAPARRGSPLARVAWIALPLALALAGSAWLIRSRPPARKPASLSGMVWLAGGTFEMGRSPQAIEAEVARQGPDFSRVMLERQQPARTVHLSPFHLDRTEVTNEQFARWLEFLSAWLEVRRDEEHKLDRYVFDRRRGLYLLDLYPGVAGIEHRGARVFALRPGFEQRPVVQLTWDAASLYCEWRGMRLPTEAEWEFAARGQTARRYPWGDAEPSCEGVHLGRRDGPCKGLPAAPQPVASASQDATPEGIRDLGGNVAEWVQDRFLAPYYPDCGDCRDPRVESAAPTAEDLRIVRGGNFGSRAGMALASNRGRWRRTEVMDGVGFRCATH